MNPDLLHSIWDRCYFRVGLDQALLLNLEDQARWVMAGKLVEADKIPNFLENIYFDGLNAVRPRRLNIAH